MGRQVTLDDDVFMEIADRAFVSGMVFGSINDVLREILNMGKKEVNNYPSSKVEQVQYYLNALKSPIFEFSKDGMVYHGKSRKWVADPNFVTITVQDARAKNLRVTIYGKPEVFESIKGSLKIEGDMAGYSRFLIENTDQLFPAVNVIKHSYKLKEERGRI